jgi:23S rRNA (uracil1939-C5)-methyltransferase
VAEQRAAKEDIVRRALRKVTGAVEPIRAPGPELGWRRRARLRYRCVGPPGRGGAVVGYARQRSHELVDAPVCPQLEPALEAALGAVRRLLLARATGAGEVELLLGAGGAVQVALDGPGAEGLAGPAAALLGEAGITGVRAGGVVLGAETLELGDGPHPFRARADLFAQASAPGNALLRALVLEAAAALAGPLAGRRVLELHAGSGNLTRDLLAAGCRVVAVDEAGPAVALARANLAPFADRVTLEARPAGPPLPGGPFDLVLVDPPRTGLEPGLAAALAALPAPLVYVSCDPQTLARDLGLLGRPVPRVVPVDLMPQTFHVEIVASVAGP